MNVVHDMRTLRHLKRKNEGGPNESFLFFRHAPFVGRHATTSSAEEVLGASRAESESGRRTVWWSSDVTFQVSLSF